MKTNIEQTIKRVNSTDPLYFLISSVNINNGKFVENLMTFNYIQQPKQKLYPIQKKQSTFVMSMKKENNLSSSSSRMMMVRNEKLDFLDLTQVDPSHLQ